MEAGSGENEYLEAFANEIIPSLNDYGPELVIISAGFDAHRDDPLANINLTEHSFARMTEMLRNGAEAWCDGRIVSVLEGGYNLFALASCAEIHLRGMMT